jgi:hypothetical protein
MIRTLAASFGLAVATTLVAAAAASPTVQPGDQSRWSLDFRASMEQSTARPIEIHMSGAWTSTISAVRANDYDAQLQLAKIQFSGDTLKSTSVPGLKDLQNRLSRPFWATYRNDGGLLSVHFYRDMSASDRNLLQMIATELQLVQPGSAHQSWTAQERDGAGEYAALYLMSQPNRIVKHKIKYIYTDGMAGAPANAMQISIDQSDVTFSLTPDHHLQSADGVDRVRMGLSQDKSQQLTAVTEFHATDLQTGTAAELAGSLVREHANVVDLPIVTQRSDSSVARAEADDRLLKDLTTDAILDAAFSKNPGTIASPDRLTALFRSRPDAAATAVALLIKNGPSKTVTNALGAAGSLSASASLSELAHNASLPQDLRVDALLAFVQLQHPTPEVMRVPVDLVADANPAVQSAARMISGALAHAGRTEHSAEADAIDASLVALYRNAKEVSEKIELLGALGNSAGPMAAQAADEALNDPSAPIRAAAARALRLAPGGDIDRRLAVVILNDSDPAVRADAIFATRFRNPLPATLADALLKVAGTDQVIYVRSDALALLRQNPNASPRIQQTLAHIAESDPDPGIRRQASDALAAVSAQASTHP